MGHDITAYKPGIDRDVAYEEFNLTGHDDGWSDRYDSYKKATEVAYNRRSAGNPLNQVLYLALGVMDEAYAGCSGNGETVSISLAQFEAAQKILRNKSFQGMKRERNFSDDIMEAFGAMGAKVIRAASDSDVSQEVEFVDKCVEFLKSNNLERLDVYFG